MDDRLDGTRRWVAVLALSAGNCVTVADASMINVALPTIAQDLHVPISASAMVVTFYQLVLLMTVLPAAALAEKFGLRRSYLAGLAVFAGAALGSIFAPNLPVLIAARALQAVGAAAAISVSPALIRYTYPPERLGSGLALNSLIVTASAMIAPALGGAVLSVASWRWIFALVLPLALVSMALGSFLPRTERHDHPYDFHAAGLSAATFLLVFGGIELGVHGGARVLCAALILMGLAIGFLFVRRERSSARPVLPVDLLGTRAIAFAVFAGFCVHTGSQAFSLALPFRLEHTYGYSPAQVGVLMVSSTLAMVVTIPFSGHLANRAPEGLLGAIGMAVSVTSYTAMALLPAHPAFLDFAWRLGLGGLGMGLFMVPNNRLIIGVAPASRMAAAGALVATTRMCGQTLGATLAGLLLAVGTGLGPTPAWIAAGAMSLALASNLVRLGAVRRPARA